MLNDIMKSLASERGIRAFTPDENGAFNIDVDLFSLEIKQRSSWIIWETTLPFTFAEDLDFQGEQMLKRCMQFSLKTLRDGLNTLTVNNDQSLVLQAKVGCEQLSYARFCALLSQHIDRCERYSALLTPEGFNHIERHTMWLP